MFQSRRLLPASGCIDIDRPIRLWIVSETFFLSGERTAGQAEMNGKKEKEGCVCVCVWAVGRRVAFGNGARRPEFHVSRRGSGSCHCSARRWFVFTESESKSRLRGTKCTLVLRDATFTFYVYSLRL